jgi:hypothetical protein
LLITSVNYIKKPVMSDENGGGKGAAMKWRNGKGSEHNREKQQEYCGQRSFNFVDSILLCHKVRCTVSIELLILLRSWDEGGSSIDAKGNKELLSSKSRSMRISLDLDLGRSLDTLGCQLRLGRHVSDLVTTGVLDFDSFHETWHFLILIRDGELGTRYTTSPDDDVDLLALMNFGLDRVVSTCSKGLGSNQLQRRNHVNSKATYRT